MIDIMSMFGLHRSGMILSVASNVIRAFEQEYAQDHNAKSAALSALIDILKQHQATPAPVEPIITKATCC